MTTIINLYRQQRDKGFSASHALRIARTLSQWDALQGEEVFEGEPVSDQCNIRLLIVPDNEVYDDSYFDTWEISDDQKEKIRAELWARIEREGVWGITGQYRVCSCDECGNPAHWEDVDSVWGFVGDDWQDSGYDTDVMQGTIDAFRDYLADLARRGKPAYPLSLLLEQ